jgi:large subunit ribosomal protein L25
MSDITLTAERRTAAGSRAAGRLRAEGKLPAVVYGKGIDAPISVALDHREVRNAFQTSASRDETFTLVLDGANHTVKLHEIQRDPVRGGAAHLDLLVV